MAEVESQSGAGKGTESQSGNNPSLDSGDSSKESSGESQTRAKGRSGSKSRPSSSSANKGNSEQEQLDQAAENRFVSHDVLTDIKAAQGPLQPTVIDGQGIERYVGPAVDDNWEPAPVDPDPELIAHNERVLAAESERREQRLGATQAKPESVREGAEVTRGAMQAERDNQDRARSERDKNDSGKES